MQFINFYFIIYLLFQTNFIILISMFILNFCPILDFEEAIDLANYYQRIFMDPNPISEQDRDQLSIDAQYFHQKHMIKKIIQLADTFMSNGSQRVKKMVLCIKVRI